MMSSIYERYSKRLQELSEPEYAAFNKKLIPGIENILGVRLPLIRKLAKELAKDDWQEYFADNQDIYMEETMLHGFTIGCLREDEETTLHLLRDFLPKINNWAVCDSVSGCIKPRVSKFRNTFWTFALECLGSTETYTIRFGVDIIMGNYIDEEHIDQILQAFSKIKSEEYYVNMGVAWAISVCFVKEREKTLAYLSECPLDNFTYNKSLQKIRESLRVSAQDKALMLTMRRK